MLSVRLAVVGKLKEQYLKDGCEDYINRLKRFCKIEVVEVKDFPDNALSIEKECELLLPKLEGKIIPLCIEGKNISSEELANYISRLAVEGNSQITFVIGGSSGLSDKIKSMGNSKLSFSKMTFPHGVMRLVLLEQIYRAFKIINNETYHK